MYVPSSYAVKDKAAIEHFIQAHPFAVLVSHADGFLATHLPLLIEENEDEKILAGHIARKNPQWKYLKEGIEVLVIFSGPDAYISSSWYDYPEVSTWDYTAVHVTGKIKLQNERQLWQSLKHLMNHFEREEKHPVALEKLPDRVKAQQKEIGGFYITIDKTEAIFKLSQNQNDANKKNIINNLEEKELFMAKEIARQIGKNKI